MKNMYGYFVADKIKKRRTFLCPVNLDLISRIYEL